MVKKINVVSLSHIKDIEEDNDEAKLIEIRAEIDKEEKHNDNTQIVEQAAKPKTKRKAAPKQKQVIAPVVEPIIESVNESIIESVHEPFIEPVNEPVIESVIEEKQLPLKKIKTVELVNCDKCGKEMTMRSLRYTHEKSCTGKKIVRDEVPVKRQTRPKAATKTIDTQEDLLKNHFQKLKEEKVRKHQEKITKLISKIA